MKGLFDEHEKNADEILEIAEKRGIESLRRCKQNSYCHKNNRIILPYFQCHYFQNILLF
jgi:hypothetical protein